MFKQYGDAWVNLELITHVTTNLIKQGTVGINFVGGGSITIDAQYLNELYLDMNTISFCKDMKALSGG